MARQGKATPTINEAFISGIRGQLERNVRVRRKLPEYGRIHIDRQLPFLAVYRQPAGRADEGTERLLLGEASYLLMQGGKRRDPSLNRLLQGIIQSQKKAFDAFLVVEIWSAGETRRESEPASRPPQFKIFSPRHHVPQPLLESMEKELLKISVAGLRAEVSLDYEDGWAPPVLKPLLTAAGIQRLGCTVVGIEVSPIYRDPASGALLPYELRQLHTALAHALKRSFYTFAHACTSHRPAHYHELGRRAMTSAVWETDKRLAEIDSSFDLLLHVTPINSDAAFHQFQRNRCEREPEFLYRPRRIDPALLKRRLYNIPLERIEDPTLAHIFAAKRDELDRQLTLIEDRGSERTLHGSLQIYGRPSASLLAEAEAILVRLPPHTQDENASHALNAAAFARRAEEELAHYREALPEMTSRVELRDDVAGVLVSRGNLLVNRHLTIPESRVHATIAHEVGTHILTFHNGRKQPFQQLRVGMANYEALQEGLAVLSEYLVGGLSRPRMRMLAGRVVAAHHIADGADFIETFRALHDGHGFNQPTAFMIAMRVFRGGGYVKDLVYLRGLIALLEHLKNGGDLEQLYLGKIALEHIDFIEELRWRQVLKPAALRPRYLDLPEIAEKRRRLRHGMSVLELLEA